MHEHTLDTHIDAGALSAPAGFELSALHAGIKLSKALDLALIVSQRPCTTAWVSTTNRVVAAPIVISLEHLRVSHSSLRGLILNSGNANAVTGARGLEDAYAMCEETAKRLSLKGYGSVKPQSLAVMSTGLIGSPLPIGRIRDSIPKLCSDLSNSTEAAANFARAMMTTDTRPKTGLIRKSKWSIGGAAKGSGMIHPNMATMLGVIVTDAEMSQQNLQTILSRCVRRSFNRISVDGDTSTNDMVLILANGASGSKPDPEEFEGALQELCNHLAQTIVRDGEGATKFVTLRIKGCRNESEAEAFGKTLATSLLTKTSWYGQDANWGRVLAAIGRAGPTFTPENVSLKVGDLMMLRQGEPESFSNEQGRHALMPDELVVEVDLHQGDTTIDYWTCDLSHRYVTINSAYKT